jgi:hypothetical protein
MTGGGPYRLESGQWTDDASMAHFPAKRPRRGLQPAVVETGGFDPQDQVERCLRGLRDGYLGSTGECFEIGRTVRASKRLRRRSPRSQLDLSRKTIRRQPGVGGTSSTASGLRYRQAVLRLLGESPVVRLCFLDALGEVKVEQA